MFKKIFSVATMLFIMNGCVGTMKVADEAPSKNIKGATMQTKADNNATKK